jgi:hypothetical protein
LLFLTGHFAARLLLLTGECLLNKKLKEYIINTNQLMFLPVKCLNKHKSSDQTKKDTENKVNKRFIQAGNLKVLLIIVLYLPLILDCYCQLMNSEKKNYRKKYLKPVSLLHYTTDTEKKTSME